MTDILKDPSIQPYILFSKSIIKYYAKSFYFASTFLPRKKKLATYVVYAYCRYVDNIIDKPRNRTKEELNNELDIIKDELIKAYNYGESEHPILGVFVKVVHQYKIPLEYALELIEGVRMDLNFNRYDNFDELYKFCYRVAAVVGLMMTYILGFKDNKALDYAEKLGIAMQLTNILRDFKEDKNNGKIYLPLNELAEFHLSELDIFEEKYNENFKNFIKYQCERAHKYYNESMPGIELLAKDSRFAIYAALRIYSAILEKIKNIDYNVFKERAYVSKLNKIIILVSEYFSNLFTSK